MEIMEYVLTGLKGKTGKRETLSLPMGKIEAIKVLHWARKTFAGNDHYRNLQLKEL